MKENVATVSMVIWSLMSPAYAERMVLHCQGYNPQDDFADVSLMVELNTDTPGAISHILMQPYTTWCDELSCILNPVHSRRTDVYYQFVIDRHTGHFTAARGNWSNVSAMSWDGYQGCRRSRRVL